MAGRVNKEALSNMVDDLPRKLNRVQVKLLLIHSMGVYKWPSGIINECTTKVRNFVWSSNCDKRKMITIKWAKVIGPRMKEGLV